MYKLIKHHRTGVENGVIIVDENKSTIIPFDPANKDYQEYLKWVAEGNTPLPAESN